MKVEPTPEHKWLQKLLGEWTFEAEADMGPDKPAEKSTGSESVRPLGDVWVIGEGRGDMPGGGEGVNIMTLGFDPQKGRFIGSWIGSMMHNMWVYDGELDATGTTLTLNTEGPGFEDQSKTAPYRDVIQFVSDNHRTLTSHVQGDDGTWTQFMTAHYRRK